MLLAIAFLPGLASASDLVYRCTFTQQSDHAAPVQSKGSLASWNEEEMVLTIGHLTARVQWAAEKPGDQGLAISIRSKTDRALAAYSIVYDPLRVIQLGAGRTPGGIVLASIECKKD